MLPATQAETRLFVWDWLGMAVAKPRGFCSSHVQDQAAFTILVYNRSLPLVNVRACRCACLNSIPPHAPAVPPLCMPLRVPTDASARRLLAQHTHPSHATPRKHTPPSCIA